MRDERAVSRRAAATGSAAEAGVLLPHPNLLTGLRRWGELRQTLGIEPDQPLGIGWLVRIGLYLVMVVGA
ncbi:MAG TPA: hypothetical protein PLQ63_01175 [Propionicimonas sp.]|nr:hypothetical protein [Propionicimonas sp.]